jgi:hypothetical protein
MVMLFLATVVATLLCGLAMYLLQQHADDTAIKPRRVRGRSMAPSLPSSVTADHAGFVARGNHSG